MPGNGICALFEEFSTGAVSRTTVDHVDLWEPLGRPRGLVDVMPAKVARVVDDLLKGAGGKVLVAEGCTVSKMLL